MRSSVAARVATWKALIGIGSAILAAVALCGCDSNVGGVTFESGFGVSDDRAFQEGFQAGQIACATNTRQIVQYKSGTDAEAAWIRGHQAALAQHCPDRM